jgi:predicted nucleic acid-binding protein
VIIAVWDTSPLWHASLADRLDVLGDCAAGTQTSPWRNVTTATVVNELKRNALQIDLSWLEVVHVDELNELLATLKWTERMGVDPSLGANIGEATVCGWAEVHGATAIIDDGDARDVAARNGLPVHGSLWVVAEAVRAGRITLPAASGFVDALISTGARYPCGVGGFVAWAQKNRLVP